MGKFELVVLIAAIAVMVIAVKLFRKALKPDLPFSVLIKDRAIEFGLDPCLVAAVVSVESGFRRDVIGSVGEIGLMQLKISTARDREPGVTEAALKDPETNIRIGCKQLAWLRNTYGLRFPRDIEAYNVGGRGYVELGRRNPGYKAKITSALQEVC